MVEIRWLKEARDDLQDIYDYISHDSDRYAERQVDKIFNRTGVLKTHIRVGRIVEEVNKSDVREIIEGNYRIIYRIINDQRVDILMVHHGARDLIRRIEAE